MRSNPQRVICALATTAGLLAAMILHDTGGSL